MKKNLNIVISALGGMLILAWYFLIMPLIPDQLVKSMIFEWQENGVQLETFALNEDELDVLNWLLSTLKFGMVDNEIEGDSAIITVEMQFLDLEQYILDNRDLWIRDMLNFHQRSLQKKEGYVLPSILKETEIRLERKGLNWSIIMTEEWLESMFNLEHLAWVQGDVFRAGTKQEN